MKYLETKHEQNSARITTLIVFIMVLLCFVVGQDYQDLPEEYGVAINFGDANTVNNNIEPSAFEDIQNTESEEEILEEEAEEEAEEVEEAKIEEEEEEVEEEETAEKEKLEEELEEQKKAEAEAAKVTETEKAAEAEKLLVQQEEEALRVKNQKEAKEAKENKAAAAKKAAAAEAKVKAQVKAEKAKAKAQKAKAQKAAAKAAAAKAAAAAAAAKKKGEGSKTVSFALIENSPIYPGCETGNNSTRKKCMNNKIKQFLDKNFNKILATDLGLSGIQKINIRFTINATGNIVGIRVKGPDSKLEVEAKRVVKLLPKMKPGMQQGRPVSVSFNLPLSIKVD